MDFKKNMHGLEYEPAIMTVTHFLTDEECANYMSLTRYIYVHYDSHRFWRKRCGKLQWSKRAIKKSNHFLRLSKQYNLFDLMSEIQKPEQLSIVELTLNQFHKNNMKLLIAILKLTSYPNLTKGIINRLKRIDRLQSYKARLLLTFSLDKIKRSSFYEVFTHCEQYSKILGSFQRIDDYMKLAYTQQNTAYEIR